jgi:uridine kinase
VNPHVVLLAGPSGTGKSRLADSLGLPVVRLDDFYRDGDDPTLPRSPLGIVDWDDPRSWDADRAMAALVRLCTTGSADMPIYDIAADGTVGHRTVSTAGATFLVAEGIFADQIAQRLRDEDLLAIAVCIRHHRLVTFVRRLYRDMRERRKPAGFWSGAGSRCSATNQGGPALCRGRLRAAIGQGRTGQDC